MKLAVLGSPIAHSKSPALHTAAYRVLGLDWSYEAVELEGAGLTAFVKSRGEEWRGLSLTMPLKRDILPDLTDFDQLVSLTGSANTVLFTNGAFGFNTDVFGITEAFRGHGVESLTRVLIVGGGATATSALVAVEELGAERVDLLVRAPGRVARLRGTADDLGLELRVHALDDQPSGPFDAVISTLPGHSEHGLVFPDDLRRNSVLFDVAYDPWPSAFALAWAEADATVISGLEMLILQALAQVRVFVNGSPTATLHNEDEVLAAMRAAVTN